MSQETPRVLGLRKDRLLGARSPETPRSEQTVPVDRGRYEALVEKIGSDPGSGDQRPMALSLRCAQTDVA